MKINIYLNENYRDQLKTLMNKYKISMSTIVDILTFQTFYGITHYSINKIENEKIMTEYIIKEGLRKTSVKPKNAQNIDMFIKSTNDKATLSIFATNSIIIYLDNKIDNYLDQEGRKYYYKKINQEMQKTKEEFYNYNNMIRSTMRFLKNDKEYIKKKIAQMEKEEQGNAN